MGKKVKEGRVDDIRPCIACNEVCLGKRFYLSCTVNPQTGLEREYALKPIERKRKVLVIGGGPGGLEAARAAAARGCDVTLWERSERLGGKLRIAAVPEFKRDIRPLINTSRPRSKLEGGMKKTARPSWCAGTTGRGDHRHRSAFRCRRPGYRARAFNTVEVYRDQVGGRTRTRRRRWPVRLPRRPPTWRSKKRVTIVDGEGGSPKRRHQHGPGDSGAAAQTGWR
jgi:hypothetical protein